MDLSRNSVPGRRNSQSKASVVGKIPGMFNSREASVVGGQRARRRVGGARAAEPSGLQ